MGKNFVRKQNNYQKKSDKPQNKFVMGIVTKYLNHCNIKLYKKKAKYMIINKLFLLLWTTVKSTFLFENNLRGKIYKLAYIRDTNYT